jgi:hypothetical protein
MAETGDFLMKGLVTPGTATAHTPSIRVILNICAFLSLFAVVIQAAPRPGGLVPICHGEVGAREGFCRDE